MHGLEGLSVNFLIINSSTRLFLSELKKGFYGRMPDFPIFRNTQSCVYFVVDGFGLT